MTILTAAAEPEPGDGDAAYPLGDAEGALVPLRLPSCEQAGRWAVVHRVTGEAIFPPCRAWRCDRCAEIKRRRLWARITAMIREAQSLGLPVYLLTFTCDRLATPEDVRRCWGRLSATLRQRGVTASYAASLESDPQGRGLHLHVILVAGHAVPDAWLRDRARAAGFAPNYDLRRVRPTEQDARRVAEYVLKRTIRLARDLKVKRPVTFSHRRPARAPRALLDEAEAWRVVKLTVGGRPVRGDVHPRPRPA